MHIASCRASDFGLLAGLAFEESQSYVFYRHGIVGTNRGFRVRQKDKFGMKYSKIIFVVVFCGWMSAAAWKAIYPIPEPITMSLLLIGGFVLPRRRNDKR